MNTPINSESAVDSETIGFSHGRQSCRDCFGDPLRPWHSSEMKEFLVGSDRWRLRANPGYWGSPTPRILVLGFSKGPEQNKRIDAHLASCTGKPSFEDIPFEDGRVMRRYLQDLLAALKLMPKGRAIDDLFGTTETPFGFASLVRCSVDFWSKTDQKWVGTGSSILGKTLQKKPAFLAACVNRHVLTLPKTVELVVMLGATEAYVDEARTLLKGIALFNEGPCYAYQVGSATFIHVPHPSGENGGCVKVFYHPHLAPRTPSEKNMPTCRKQVDATLAALSRLCPLLPASERVP